MQESSQTYIADGEVSDLDTAESGCSIQASAGVRSFPKEANFHTLPEGT